MRRISGHDRHGPMFGVIFVYGAAGRKGSSMKANLAHNIAWLCAAPWTCSQAWWFGSPKGCWHCDRGAQYLNARSMCVPRRWAVPGPFWPPLPARFRRRVDVAVDIASIVTAAGFASLLRPRRAAMVARGVPLRRFCWFGLFLCFLEQARFAGSLARTPDPRRPPWSTRP